MSAALLVQNKRVRDFAVTLLLAVRHVDVKQPDDEAEEWWPWVFGVALMDGVWHEVYLTRVFKNALPTDDYEVVICCIACDPHEWLEFTMTYDVLNLPTVTEEAIDEMATWVVRTLLTIDEASALALLDSTAF